MITFLVGVLIKQDNIKVELALAKISWYILVFFQWLSSNGIVHDGKRVMAKLLANTEQMLSKNVVGRHIFRLLVSMAYQTLRSEDPVQSSKPFLEILPEVCANLKLIEPDSVFVKSDT